MYLWYTIDCVHILVFAGLEYKFMVKSVDPDASYVVTGGKTTSKPKDLPIAISTTTELHEERMGQHFEKVTSNPDIKEMTSTFPLNLEEARISLSHTGKKKL